MCKAYLNILGFLRRDRRDSERRLLRIKSEDDSRVVAGHVDAAVALAHELARRRLRDKRTVRVHAMARARIGEGHVEVRQRERVGACREVGYIAKRPWPEGDGPGWCGGARGGARYWVPVGWAGEGRWCLCAGDVGQRGEDGEGEEMHHG